MIVIGLAGGAASGKSLVAQEFARLGAVVLDGDRLGHAVLDEPEVRQALWGRWGDRVLDRNKRIDRRAVAAIVFAAPPDGPRELAFLERLTHPRIERRLEQQLAECQSDPEARVVVDAALMFKAGWDRHCDEIIFVDVPPSTRLARAQQRGWSAAEWAAREAAQGPLDARRAAARHVIDNSGPPQALGEQVQRIWQQLRAPRPDRHVNPAGPRADVRRRPAEGN